MRLNHPSRETYRDEPWSGCEKGRDMGGEKTSEAGLETGVGQKNSWQAPPRSKAVAVCEQAGIEIHLPGQPLSRR